MKTSGVISIVGSVVAVVFGYFCLAWIFLINASAWDYVAMTTLCALLGLVGALPGLLIGRFISRRGTVPPTQASNDTPPSSTS